MTEEQKHGLLEEKIENGREQTTRPVQWEPPIELSTSEQVIVKRIRRAKLFIFLREHRHEVFDPACQEELASLDQESPRGQPPVAPALLALATILQASTGASADEVIERTIEVAKQAGTFGAGSLRAALDSSPLWGAGRVEDTYNLLGHALVSY